MGKVSPKKRNTKFPKQRRRLRSSCSKLLKPGALAQLPYNKASTTKLFADLGKERVTLLSAKKVEDRRRIMFRLKIRMLIELHCCFCLFICLSIVKTPSKTPQFEEYDSESRIESLPMDLLVKIPRHLHHDQLRAVFHVSQRIRKAVMHAKQFHFN